MENVQKSPSLTTKLKTRIAANKLKHGSPKLQEVLRQRCRERMREKRGQLFDKRRQGFMEIDEEVHETLTEILRQELSELSTLDANSKELLDLDTNESMTVDEALALEYEFLAEEEQWIIQEYEKLQQEEFGLLDQDQQDVFCPLCEKGLITESGGVIACPMCSLRLPLKTSVADFATILLNSTALHSSRCRVRPSFMVLPENDTVSLYLTCDTCSFFSII